MKNSLALSFLLATLAVTSALHSAPLVIDDFEFATDNTAAAAGVTVVGSTATGTAVSGSAANANQGSFSLGLDGTFPGNAFEDVRYSRTLASPLSLGGSFTPGGPSGSSLADLAVTIDVKGTASYAGSGTDATTGTNLWILLQEADGDIWRFINFTDPALSSSSFTDDHRLIGLVDRDGASTGDGAFTEIVSYTILVQNPFAEAKAGTIYVDDFKIEVLGASPAPTFVYTIPLIDSVDAPNVTDGIFDAIYSNGGAHEVIEGDEWKDWNQRGTNIEAGISTNTTNPTAASGIFNDSKAYLISDGTTLYFGMIVSDTNTALMTADSADDTLNKFNVEDIEVAFSTSSGTAGAADAVKFALDAFGHIDDMMPDGVTAINTTAKVNSNSYIINSTTWACEFSVGIQELANLSLANLSTPLSATPSVWYGHIGYQSPGLIIPLYAAGSGNGFGDFLVQFDFSEVFVVTDAEGWMNYQ